MGRLGMEGRTANRRGPLWATGAESCRNPLSVWNTPHNCPLQQWRNWDPCLPIPVLHGLRVVPGTLNSYYCGVSHTKAKCASVVRERPQAESQKPVVGRPGSIWELSIAAVTELWVGLQRYRQGLEEDFLEEWKFRRPAVDKEKNDDGLDSLWQWNTEERTDWRNT